MFVNWINSIVLYLFQCQDVATKVSTTKFPKLHTLTGNQKSKNFLASTTTLYDFFNAYWSPEPFPTLEHAKIKKFFAKSTLSFFALYFPFWTLHAVWIWMLKKRVWALHTRGTRKYAFGANQVLIAFFRKFCSWTWKTFKDFAAKWV